MKVKDIISDIGRTNFELIVKSAGNSIHVYIDTKLLTCVYI